MKAKPPKKAQPQDDAHALHEAFLQLKTHDECQKFLTDICTPAEIKALTERWKVARLLSEGATSYREIHAQTGVSVTTIGRVARFLLLEPHQGYSLVLKRLASKK